jgi:hypothetical protein
MYPATHRLTGHPEAIDAFRELVELNRGAYLPNLATSLTQSTRLAGGWESGQVEGLQSDALLLIRRNCPTQRRAAMSPVISSGVSRINRSRTHVPVPVRFQVPVPCLVAVDGCRFGFR